MELACVGSTSDMTFTTQMFFQFIIFFMILQVLREKKFSLIEKIKTVSSCYMAASGLVNHEVCYFIPEKGLPFCYYMHFFCNFVC